MKSHTGPIFKPNVSLENKLTVSTEIPPWVGVLSYIWEDAKGKEIVWQNNVKLS